MKLPTGSYLVKPLEMLPGGLIKGVVRDKGVAYTEHGEEWKAKVDNPSLPDLDDEIIYPMDSSSWSGGRTEIVIEGVLYHIISSYKLIL